MHSTMGQEELTSLEVSDLENSLTKNFYFIVVKNDFATKKARKLLF